MKPSNMNDLTEVITTAEFHPRDCNIFVYGSSMGKIRLCDMRQAAICDKEAKCEYSMCADLYEHSDIVNILCVMFNKIKRINFVMDI